MAPWEHQVLREGVLMGDENRYCNESIHYFEFQLQIIVRVCELRAAGSRYLAAHASVYTKAVLLGRGLLCPFVSSTQRGTKGDVKCRGVKGTANEKEERERSGCSQRQ